MSAIIRLIDQVLIHKGKKEPEGNAWQLCQGK